MRRSCGCACVRACGACGRACVCASERVCVGAYKHAYVRKYVREYVRAWDESDNCQHLIQLRLLSVCLVNHAGERLQHHERTSEQRGDMAHSSCMFCRTSHDFSSSGEPRVQRVSEGTSGFVLSCYGKRCTQAHHLFCDCVNVR